MNSVCTLYAHLLHLHTIIINESRRIHFPSPGQTPNQQEQEIPGTFTDLHFGTQDSKTLPYTLRVSRKGISKNLSECEMPSR